MKRKLFPFFAFALASGLAFARQQGNVPQTMCIAAGVILPCDQAQAYIQQRAGGRLVDNPANPPRRTNPDRLLDDRLDEVTGGTTVGAVYRADTMTPLPGTRVGRKPVGVPTGFDKPCKAQTVSDISEKRFVMTNAQGIYSFTTLPASAVDPTRPVVLDDTTRHLLEMEQMRRIAARGITSASGDEVAAQRIPQSLVNMATATSPIPLGQRSLVESEITAELEGFVEVPSKYIRPDVFGLVPAPTISGRVMGPNGQPLAGAVVQAYEVRHGPLGRTMKWVKSTLTDDLGEYRLAWLRYGWYYIAAGHSSYALQPWMEGLRMSPNLPEPDQGTPLQFFPGIESAIDAELVHIKAPTQATPSTTVLNVVLNLKQRPRFNVRVQLTGDLIPPNANLVFVPQGGDVCASIDYAIQRTSDGSFELRDVPRGRYSMVAIAGKDVVSALMEVNVEKNIDDIRLTVVPPFTVNGTITFEGLPPGIDPKAVLGELRVNLTRARSEVSRVATTLADPKTLNFSISGVGPGLYYPTVELPPGAYVKRIRTMKPEPAPAGQPSDNWSCKAVGTDLYAYLDGHGHLNPLEIPRSLSTDNPNDPLCLNVVISFEGQVRGLLITKVPPEPPPPGLQIAPRMLVLVPSSAWMKWGDNGVTPPDRIPVVDASGGFNCIGVGRAGSCGEFYGIPFDNYKIFAVEYQNADLIYRPEFLEWFASYGLTMRYETVAPCPGTDPVLCTVMLPTQQIVDRVVP